jgi:hypothetical protein
MLGRAHRFEPGFRTCVPARRGFGGPTERRVRGRVRHAPDDVTRRAICVGLEVGKTWLFASAVDWPGWSRRGKGEDAAHQVGLLQECWRSFDRDGIIEHVQRAERSYGRKIGARVPPRTPWSEHCATISLGLVADDGSLGPTRWPPRYLARRASWHVLDHARELEDRSAR